MKPTQQPEVKCPVCGHRHYAIICPICKTPVAPINH